jgi:hypothetical protein
VSCRVSCFPKNSENAGARTQDLRIKSSENLRKKRVIRSEIRWKKCQFEAVGCRRCRLVIAPKPLKLAHLFFFEI